MINFIVIFVIFLFTQDVSLSEQPKLYCLPVMCVDSNDDITLIRIYHDGVTLNIPVSSNELLKDRHLFEENGLGDVIESIEERRKAKNIE